MYKIKYTPPWFSIYNEVNDFIVRCNCYDNAELIKRLLNYDSAFKKSYFPFTKYSKGSKISFEKLVNNNEL